MRRLFLSCFAFACLAFVGVTSLKAQVPIAPPPVQAENLWILDLSNGGRVVIQLRPDAAPKHVERIKSLTREGFYNGTIFHRVIGGFMAQGGDPTGTGAGGSKLPDLQAEFNNLPHLRGAVAMARAENPHSANSQFYIVLQPVLRLDGHYTVLGRVIKGMGWVDKIEKGEPPANPTRLVKAWIGDDPKMADMVGSIIGAAGKKADKKTGTSAGTTKSHSASTDR